MSTTRWMGFAVVAALGSTGAVASTGAFGDAPVEPVQVRSELGRTAALLGEPPSFAPPIVLSSLSTVALATSIGFFAVGGYSVVFAVSFLIPGGGLLALSAVLFAVVAQERASHAEALEALQRARRRVDTPPAPCTAPPIDVRPMLELSRF